MVRFNGPVDFQKFTLQYYHNWHEITREGILFNKYVFLYDLL